MFFNRLLVAGLLAACLVSATAVVSVTTAQEKPTVGEKNSAATPPQRGYSQRGFSQQREHYEQVLDTMVAVDFQDAPLKDVVAHFAKNHKINIVIDEVSLADEGISNDTPVTFKLSGIKLREALRLMLQPLQLEAIIRDEVLVLTTAIKTEGILETRIYNVQRELGVPASAINIASLRKVITTCVAPDSWEVVGGQGIIAGRRAPRKRLEAGSRVAKEQRKRLKSRMADEGIVEEGPLQNNRQLSDVDLTGVLVIRQSQRVHREIEELFQEIKRHYVPNTPSTDRRQAAVRMGKALDKRVAVEFNDLPLGEGIHQLATRHEIPVVIDESALADEGISTDSPLNLRVKGVSLRTALRLALQPLELTAVIDGSVLKITTMIKAEEMMIVKAYNVHDLMMLSMYDTLIEILTTNVSQDSWDQVGGPGTILGVGAANRKSHKKRNSVDDKSAPKQKTIANPKLPSVLVIRQTHHVHRDIVELLRKIRNHQIPSAQPTVRERAAAPIRKALDQRVTVDFDDITLKEAIEQLALQHKIPVVIDELALEDEGISTDTPLRLRVKEISLRSTLKLALRPLQLKAVIDGEVLKVTSLVKAERMLVSQVYDVHDLLLQGDFLSLMETLMASIAPISWENDGGAGTFSPFAVTHLEELSVPNGEIRFKVMQTGTLLVVQQTEDVQRKISALLSGLRQVKR